MASLNLICHGMMLFVNERDRIDILIPLIAQHDYRIGDPARTPPPVADNLETLASGQYRLTGPATRNGQALLDVNPRTQLILHRERFDLKPTEAHVRIEAPQPDRVRLFREIDLSKPDHEGQLPNIFGSTPTDVAFAEPRVLHDVVVLGYDSVPDGTSVGVSDVFTVTARDGAPANICIYSQVGPLSRPKDPGSPVRHETGLNDLLVFHDDRRNPDFRLSAVRDADDAPEPIGDGMSAVHMSSLFELKAFTTSGTGCTAGFIG